MDKHSETPVSWYLKRLTRSRYLFNTGLKLLAVRSEAVTGYRSSVGVAYCFARVVRSDLAIFQFTRASGMCPIRSYLPKHRWRRKHVEELPKSKSGSFYGWHSCS